MKPEDNVTPEVVPPESAAEPIVPSAEIPPAPPIAAAGQVASGPKMVTVSEDALLELQQQIRDLNLKVNQTADRSRLADFNTKQNKKVIPTCRINYFRDQNGDKLILGWGNMTANVAKYGKNFEQVNQRTVLFLKDPSAKDGVLNLDVEYTTFLQNKFQEEVDITGKKELPDGRVIFDILKKDGETFEMDSRFIN